jgi:hypothetical protein
MVVLGLGLVLFDFRTEALDLLPDLVGWGLVALAAGRLGLHGPARLAAVAGVVSVAELWLPYHYIWIHSVTGEVLPGQVVGDFGRVHLRYHDVSGLQLAGMALGMVMAGWAVWALLSALAGRAAAHGRHRPARELRAARWLVVGLWTLPFLGAVAQAVAEESGEFDPVWNGRLAYTWLAAVGVFVYVAVVLLRERDHLWALPDGSVQATRWDLARVLSRDPTGRD